MLSKALQESDAAKAAEAKRLVEAMHSKIIDEFRRYKEIHLNPNTKGLNHEKVVADMLEEYIGNLFGIHIRAQVIDVNLHYLSLFGKGSNEIDVVGTFRNNMPNIILKIGDTKVIPYDGTAFIIEVKSTMDKDRLESDLKKLDRIRQLPLTPKRYGAFSSGNCMIDRPLRLLFYFERSIAEETMDSLLETYYDSWDAIVILSENNTLLNPKLPINSAIIPAEHKDEKIVGWGGNAFVLLLIIILTSIPNPVTVNVLQTILNLDTLSKQQAK